ncbi:pyruvate decarboxylase [Colletotrichum tofieldiae]|uniref:Pyruvate decarboxylase n=1 Tax=Colletotrichum tofieldiae TaxID=708197 RepID=A0A166S0W5_9PEZI|nr:pyruvate decarboxylase [Colletotrichum tofieldiae]GKT90214.1 pyruvate decarboxylase [Colletotrichum tofieldiae]
MPVPNSTITFDYDSVRMSAADEKITNGRVIPIKSALSKLLERLQTTKIPTPDRYPKKCLSLKSMLKHLPKPAEGSIVDQYSLWLVVSSFLRPRDVVMTETGTAAYGGQSLILPENTVLINSCIWLLIGYMLSACQGAALAQRDKCIDDMQPPGRTILFEGEGSLQMTAQSISDIIRNKLDVIIFVLNNRGYTIVRLIHGVSAKYNDIQPWRNLEACSYFGALKDDSSYPVRTFSAENWGRLREVLADPELQRGKGLNIVEVAMDVADAPRSLKLFTECLEKRNGGKA